MTSFKRTQRKYVQKAYRVRNWREYETGLRARGSLTVWLGLTDGKLANWNSPRPTRRKPGRQRQYSHHAIETTVTLGLVFGLASRQTEGFLRSLLTLLNLDNDVPDHSTISRRKARLGKVASSERRTVKPVHLRIDSSGLSVHVGQLRTPPKARDYRKRHLAVDEQTSDVVAGALTSKRARDASRVASLVGQIERPIASAKADAAYDTGDVYQTLENHRAHRSPKVLIPPRTGAQLALDSAGTRQRTRNIRARSRVGKRKWYVASGYSRRSKVETTFHRYKAILGLSDASEGTGVPESRGEVGVQDPEHHDGARDTRWRDDRMTGRRSHGRLSALNGVVHQGTDAVIDDLSSESREFVVTREPKRRQLVHREVVDTWLQIVREETVHPQALLKADDAVLRTEGEHAHEEPDQDERACHDGAPRGLKREPRGHTIDGQDQVDQKYREYDVVEQGHELRVVRERLRHLFGHVFSGDGFEATSLLRPSVSLPTARVDSDHRGGQSCGK